MENALASYSFNNKKFILYLNENKLNIGYLQGKDIITDLTEEEKEAANKVIESLLIDQNKIEFMRNLVIKNINYKIYYDNEKQKYFWINDQNIDDKEINRYLNERYNIVPDILCDQSKFENDFNEKRQEFENEYEESEEKLREWHRLTNSELTSLEEKAINEYNKRVRRKQIIKLTLYVTTNLAMLASLATIYLNSLKKIAEPKDIQEIEIHTEISVEEISTGNNKIGMDKTFVITKNKYEDEDINSPWRKNGLFTHPYSWMELESLIDENPYLSDEDKQYIKNLKFIFDRYHEHMNYDTIIERLPKLKIKKINFEESDYAKKLGKGVLGLFSIKDTTIEVYTDRILGKNEYNIVLLHEFNHVLQNVHDTNRCLELSNTKFTSEAIKYMYENELLEGNYTEDEAYCDTLYFYNELADLLTLDQRLEYQFNPNIKTLARQIGGYSPKTFEMLDDLNETIQSVESTASQFHTDYQSTIDSLYSDISPELEIERKKRHFFNIAGSHYRIYIENDKATNDNLKNIILKEAKVPDWCYDDKSIVRIERIKEKSFFSDDCQEYVFKYIILDPEEKQKYIKGEVVLTDEMVEEFYRLEEELLAKSY